MAGKTENKEIMKLRSIIKIILIFYRIQVLNRLGFAEFENNN